MFLMTLKTEIASEPNPHMPSSLCSAAGFWEGVLEQVAFRTLLLLALRDSLVEWTLELGCPAHPSPGSWFH